MLTLTLQDSGVTLPEGGLSRQIIGNSSAQDTCLSPTYLCLYGFGGISFMSWVIISYRHATLFILLFTLFHLRPPCGLSVGSVAL